MGRVAHHLAMYRSRRGGGTVAKLARHGGVAPGAICRSTALTSVTSD
jgi:hypothetical protein